jgi:hypothetical protein
MASCESPSETLLFIKIELNLQKNLFLKIRLILEILCDFENFRKF